MRLLRLLGLVAIATLFACEESVVLEKAPTIAVAPFSSTGDAESGPYARMLFNIDGAVAAELGARTNWTVVENERLDALENERDIAGQPQAAPVEVESDNPFADFPGAVDASQPVDVTEYAAAFPSADYVLIGRIAGFDVQPVRTSPNNRQLSQRKNRVRASFEYRVVVVDSRQWAASGTLALDTILDDNRASETQVNDFLRVAAGDIVTQVLLGLNGPVTITEVVSEGLGSKVRLSGGSTAGLRAGDELRIKSDMNQSADRSVMVQDVYSDYAIATTLASALAGEQVELRAAQTQADDQHQVTIGITACTDSGLKESEMLLFHSLQSRVGVRLHGYGDFQLIEDRPLLRDKLLAQQVLDDLSKGREPGLPLGSLRGVDYLVFCSVERFSTREPRAVTEDVVGNRVTRIIPAQAELLVMNYIVDVNSGAMVVAESVHSTIPLRTTEDLATQLIESWSQEIFRALMLGLRPLSIAVVGEDFVALNHSQAVGLSRGDRFEVFSRGATTTDASSNEQLHNVGGRRIGVFEISSFDAQGWALGQMIEGDRPQAGYLLRTTEDQQGSRTNSEAQPKVW